MPDYTVGPQRQLVSWYAAALKQHCNTQCFQKKCSCVANKSNKGLVDSQTGHQRRRTSGPRQQTVKLVRLASRNKYGGVWRHELIMPQMIYDNNTSGNIPPLCPDYYCSSLTSVEHSHESLSKIFYLFATKELNKKKE